MQQSNAAAAAAPRSPAAAAAAAPPAAPPSQFKRPGDALASGAVADSQREAARAHMVASPPPSAEEVEERHAVAGAAAVATEAAAEVLAADGDEVHEGEAAGPAGAPPAEPQGEEESALAAELRAEALPGDSGAAVVLTPEGETALAPEAPAKGAGAWWAERWRRDGDGKCVQGAAAPAAKAAAAVSSPSLLPPTRTGVALSPQCRRAAPARCRATLLTWVQAWVTARFVSCRRVGAGEWLGCRAVQGGWGASAGGTAREPASRCRRWAAWFRSTHRTQPCTLAHRRASRRARRALR